MPLGSLGGSALHTAVDVDSCILEDFISLACVTLTVCLTTGIQTHLGDGTEDEGGSGEGRGAYGGGREGSEDRRCGGEVEGEGGTGSARSGRGGKGGGEGQERGKGVRTRGGGTGRGGEGGGEEGGGGRFGGWGRFSEMFLLVSTVSIQVGVSLLKGGELKMQGIEGESSKEQSAGEMMTLGSSLSSTVLETVGKVENEEWEQGEEKEEPEDRDFNCLLPCIIRDSRCLISSFSDKFVSSVVRKGLLLPLVFGEVLMLSFSAFSLLLCHCSRSMVSGLSGCSHTGILGKSTGLFHILWVFSFGPMNLLLAFVLGKKESTKCFLSEKSESVGLWSTFSL